MNTINIIKRISAAAIAAILCAAVLFYEFTAHGDERKIEKITLLGDSITYGFGLSEEEHNYGWYLGEYYGAEVSNYAENGLTTDGLLEKLELPEIEASVKNSDIVCLSIGGNDLLHIFIQALSDGSASGSISGDFSEGLNISAEFIQSFIMDYSSAFASAATTAGENIGTIKNRIEEINPGAEIVIHTIYNPLESENEDKNTIMKPLKTFASMYLATINNAVRDVCPDTADIQLKFSEKPYLFTNIDNYDIHPNSTGHLLIAEEIIQTLGISGDQSAIKDAFNSLPYGTVAQFPESIKSELQELSEGQLRRGTLKQAMENKLTSAETEDTSDTAETTEDKKQETDAPSSGNSSKSTTKKSLSKMFMILGFLIIICVSLIRIIKKRKNK